MNMRVLQYLRSSMCMAFSSSSSRSSGSSSSSNPGSYSLHASACRDLAALQAAVLQTVLAMQGPHVQQQLSEVDCDLLDGLIDDVFFWHGQHRGS
jgi:hypothetical protein